MRNIEKLRKERQKIEKLKNEVIGWAATCGQQHVAIEISRMWLNSSAKPRKVRLYPIENKFGEVDLRAINVNKQAIFRWLRSDSIAASAKVQELAKALTEALPAERRARLEGRTVNYLISMLLRDTSNMITAILLEDRSITQHVLRVQNALHALQHQLLKEGHIK
ncbi:toxin YdaT domain-containing protein [Serratia fonticola]|uniref:toxin YdaT domain-containing protein n=1 Tax=Serratia fonticola TaxID=47917 RepID=UPI002179EB72|nr:toxin YdaT domain-containing protein [Serratia fonticola]CAI0833621.1 Protein of uncharacterised function (DUF1019) [Serratia fonticola]CAI0956459.1 Protein of uncharacterised function (DUF1019) [Serratia fonticola]